jgi:membrane-bound serine protease (ClpP class)
MDLWLVLVLYAIGVGLVVVESFTPGIIIGLIGVAVILVSTIYGFRLSTALGIAQIAGALLLGPALFHLGLRRLSLKSTLSQASSFSQDRAELVGMVGLAETDLRPSGIALIDGRRFDVVTRGEGVDRGSRVRVVKVEGIRVVVQAT